ncbi:MAG: hypothetical protein ACREMA_04040 [Longimicrobiales bacterium]
MQGIQLIAALLLAAWPILARGQSPATLCPGDKSLNESRIKAGRWNLQVTAKRAGQAESMHGQQEIRRITVAGKPAFQLVQVYHSTRHTATDTTVMLAEGLVPVSHRSHSNRRQLDLNFAGRSVTGRTVTGGTATPFQRETAEPVFDSSALELILAAVPLKSGFRTRMPMYIHEQNGLVWHDLTVLGEESVQMGSAAVPAWQVEVKTPTFNITYLISKQTQDALGMRTSNANMSFQMKREPIS